MKHKIVKPGFARHKAHGDGVLSPDLKKLALGAPTNGLLHREVAALQTIMRLSYQIQELEGSFQHIMAELKDMLYSYAERWSNQEESIDLNAAAINASELRSRANRIYNAITRLKKMSAQERRVR